METNITKGEWFVSNDNQIVSMPSQCKITNRVSGWNPEEAKANAKLMSASPNMLEALLSIYEDKEAWNELSDDQKQKVEESIKKATE